MNSIKFLLTGMVATSLLFISCKKDEEPTPGTPTKATITGYVWADLDLTEPGMEHAPAGTKIIAWINTAELQFSPTPGATYPKKFYEVTVGSDGKYTLSVDVGNNPVTVHITPGDFWYDQQINATETEGKKYSMNPVSITVLHTQTKYLDLSFF